MLEDEVDDEGDVEALIVGGHDDAVRALAARRCFHRQPAGPSGGSLLPQASALSGANHRLLPPYRWSEGLRI